MATTLLNSHSNPYNVVIQVVKFLLVAFALYQFSLATQLAVKLPATLVLVDATPELQLSGDRSFFVTFYGLHFFANYHDIEVRVSLVSAQGEQQLRPQRIQKIQIPFYSMHFDLPSSFSPGLYQFRYEIAFDGRSDRVRKTGKTYVVSYYVISPCQPITGGPLTVRQGQRVALPAEWDGMELLPLTGQQQVAIETHNDSKWMRAQPSSRQGLYTIKFRSMMLVSGVDQNHMFIETTNAQTGQAGPRVYWDRGTLFCSMAMAGRDCIGAPIDINQVEPNDRIAFTCRVEGTRHIATRIVVAPQNQNCADIELTLVVQPNEPPRSAYDADPPEEVSLYTSWSFYESPRDGSAIGRDFFNLNRYIIDPDGRKADTNEPDVRITNLSLDPNFRDPRFSLERTSAGEFRLYVNPSAQQVFGPIKITEAVRVALIAQDEINRKSLTLRISRDR
jgi:hypothetical protein